MYFQINKKTQCKLSRAKPLTFKTLILLLLFTGETAVYYYFVAVVKAAVCKKVTHVDLISVQHASNKQSFSFYVFILQITQINLDSPSILFIDTLKYQLFFLVICQILLQSLKSHLDTEHFHIVIFFFFHKCPFWHCFCLSCYHLFIATPARNLCLM